MEEKIRLLEQTGIDHLIIHPFTKEFSRTPSLDFVREILVNTIGVKFFVIGYDHHFGRNREGSFEHLKEFSPIYGFEVEEISALDIDQVNVSSTKIRNALKAGEVELAHEYLGHPYSLEGVVTEGRKLGRELGFPTANVHTAFKHKLYPADGVYAGWAVLDGQRFKAMANLGARPTIGSLERKLEVHLFEFAGNLYGQSLTFEVHYKLRDVLEFGNLDALKAQIAEDGDLALKRLA
jgi:riboflavin kinase/FMN adenylyltransferase